jgi:hypothetical protein
MDPQPGAVPRARRGYFWKGLLIFLGLFLVVVFFLIWQAYCVKLWLEHGAESTAAILPAPRLTTEEEDGLRRLYASYETCCREKKDFEALVTPEQLNRFLADMIRKEKSEGKTTKLEAFHLAFEGREIILRGTAAVPQQPGSLYNFEVRGDMAVDRGQVTWRLDTLRLHDVSAPWAAMFMARREIAKGLKAQEALYAEGQDSLPSRVRLLRREGEKVHVVLEGKYLQPPAN